MPKNNNFECNIVFYDANSVVCGYSLRDFKMRIIHCNTDCGL